MWLWNDYLRRRWNLVSKALSVQLVEGCLFLASVTIVSNKSTVIGMVDSLLLGV